MNTGKIIIHPHATQYSTCDENSSNPVNLLKIQEKENHKKKTVKLYKNYH